MNVVATKISKLQKYDLLWFIALVAAGLCGNYLKFPLFLNIDLLFGSIFALLVLLFHGYWRGILAGALIASYTFIIWNHPYAIIILTAEIAIVGYLVKRRKMGVVLADGLYWLFAGLPLAFLLYRLVMEASPENVEIIMAKQAINGIANAVVAGLIYNAIAIRKRSYQIKLRDVITNQLIAFLLLTALAVMAFSSRQDFANMDKSIRSALIYHEMQLNEQLNKWLQNRSSSIIYLAKIGAEKTPLELQRQLEHATKSDSNFLSMSVQDNTDTGIAFYPLIDKMGEANIGRNFSDRLYLAAIKQSLKPVLSEISIARTGAPAPRVAILMPIFSDKGYNGYVAGALNLNQIKAMLDTNVRETGLHYTLIDKNDKVIMTNRSDQTVMNPFFCGAGTITQLDKNISQWVPILSSTSPASERWKSSKYFVTHEVGEQGEWTLVLEQPVAPYQMKLFESYANKFTLLFLILIFALAVAERFSREALKSLNKLNSLSHALPDKIASSGNHISWPESGIEETQQLMANFRAMANILTTQFGKIRDSSALLEQRVTDRTNDLRESKSRYERAVNGVNDGIWEWIPATGEAYLSPRWKQLLGYEDHELPNVQESFFDNIHPDEVSSVSAAIHDHLVDHKPYEIELRLRGKNGDYRWFLTRGQADWDELGEPIRMTGSMNDITEQKTQKLKAAAVQQKLQATLAAIPDLLFELDLEGRYLDVHSPRTDLMAAPAEQLLGRNIREYLPSSAVKVCMAALHEALDKGSSTGQQFEMQLPQGRFWFELSVSRKVDSVTMVPSFIVLSRDITERKNVEQAILQSEAHFRQMFERNTSVMLLLEPSTAQIVDANLAASLFYGYTLEQLKTMPITQLNSLPVKDVTDRLEHSMRKGGNHLIISHLLASGEERFVEVRSSPMRVDGSDLLLTIIHDVTEHQQSQAKLQLAASVFELSREGIMITEDDGTIIDVNEAFTRITGYPKQEVIGQNPRILKSGLQGTEHYGAMWRDLKAKGHWYGEVWNRRKNGEIYAEMQTITSVHDPDGGPVRYVSLFSDITSLKEHEKQLEHIAHFDALTGLPNRVLLADRMHQAMSQAARREQQVAVAFLDLDGFKEVNDLYGHEAGDQLLIALASRMKDTLREGDTLSRIGGDEFVAVLVDLDSFEDSLPMINRLLLAAAEPVLSGGVSLQVSASLGVTFYPQEEDIDADQLQRQADQAMYLAKQGGKNRYHVFDAIQDRSMRGHHESLERIRRALKDDEFRLFYQPKVNMCTGEVVGAEALIRWQHPQNGLLAPAAFLPVIEDHVLAVSIGEWVIETALTQMDIWHEQGLDIPVSVNVGARQLQQKDFVARLRYMLTQHPQVQPGCLQLEVLETSALEDIAQVSQIIEACAQMGVLFALDDFGTGYSSLTYLKRLSVAELKIDQSFVRDMLDDPEDLAILEGVIGLAKAFRREVIAEGVETIEHGEMLLQLGCEMAQGYGIARPMPADQMPEWAATWQSPLSWVNCFKVRHEDLPLLYAMVEHRAWIEKLKGYFEGRRSAPPQMNHHQCRFGVMLDRMLGKGASSNNRFNRIEPLHQQVHELAIEFCDLKESGQVELAMSRMHELFSLRDELLEHLKRLLTYG